MLNMTKINGRDKAMLSVSETQKIWQPLANALVVPRNEELYQRLVNWLDKLIDAVGEDESHPWAV
jgi:HTH-type transcriptional regulator / antitoxin HigA